MAFNTIYAKINYFLKNWATVVLNAGIIFVNVISESIKHIGNMFFALANLIYQSFSMVFMNIARRAEALALLPIEIVEHGAEEAGKRYAERLVSANQKMEQEAGKVVEAYTRTKNVAKNAAANIAGEAFRGTYRLPQYREPEANKTLAQRARNIIAQLQKERTQKRVDEAKQKAKKLLEDAIRGAGASVKGAAAGAVDMAGGAARGVAGMFRGKEEEKKAKAEFVGIADLSKKIQLGILNSEEEKDRKAMVKGIDVVGKGVKGVKDGVRDVYNAVKDWIPKAS
jgi:vacuolar-type H+-ATPase subunit H